MSVTYTLTADGVVKSLEGWGISEAKLVHRNQDDDELVVRTPRNDIFEDPAFTYGQTLTLREGSTVRFVGTLAISRVVANGKQEYDEFVVKGAWWLLSRLVYQQPRMIKSDDFTALNTEDTTRVILGQDDTGARITTGTQISAILAYALEQGVAIGTGIMPAFVTGPLDECRDITCAEAIRRQIALTPDAVAWFDYSAGTPVFNVQRRVSLTPKSYDLGDQDRIVEFTPAPRQDLVPLGVVFIFTTTEVNDDKTWTRVTRDTAGLTSGVGVITATIEMMGAGTDNQEAPPIGLALQYYTALQTTPWEGELRLLELDCSGDVLPGMVVNLTGGRAAWASMNAVVQIVTEELMHGITTVDLGLPQHLSPQDFVNQLFFNRKVARPPEPTNLATTKPPNKSDGITPNGDAGKDPKSYTGAQTATGNSIPLNTVSRDFCVDGEIVTNNVYVQS